MATLLQDRMYPYTRASADGPQTLMFPIAAAQTLVAGAAMVHSGGNTGTVAGISNVVLATAAAAAVGILEIPVTTPASLTLVPITVALPNFIWEGSLRKATASAQTDLMVTVSTLNSNSGLSNVCVIGVATTTPSVRPIAFVSQMHGVPGYPFLDKNAASATTSTTSFTPNVSKGIVGDTDPRLLFTWTPEACSLIRST